ncbi:MAG: DUF2752 domain-containing protein [Planctomycetota bacterium]|nr:DUF2752 domain-containing protein [Planctomycetota bacterium]
MALTSETSETSAPVAPKRSLEHWALLSGAILAAFAVLVLGTWIEPDPRGFGTHEKLGMGACNFLAWTGIPCPGCGVTTSVSLAAHGSFRAAFWNQPFGLIVALLAPLAALVAIVQHARGRDLGATLRALRPAWWGLGLGIAAAAGWAWKIVAMRAGHGG